MDWKARASVVTALAESVSKQLGWCGERHLHNAVFLMQAISTIPLSYEFVSDRGGPFSFDLQDDLALFRSRGVLRVEAQPAPYGPTYVVALTAKNLDPAGSAERAIELVADRLARLNAVKTDCLTTALLVTKSMGQDVAAERRVQRLMELKPHVERDTAKMAIDAADELVRDRAQL